MAIELLWSKRAEQGYARLIRYLEKVYYSAILIPLLILFLLMNKINSVTFSVVILVWAGIYRPVVDGIRLIELVGLN